MKISDYSLDEYFDLQKLYIYLFIYLFMIQISI